MVTAGAARGQPAANNQRRTVFPVFPEVPRSADNILAPFVVGNHINYDDSVVDDEINYRGNTENGVEYDFHNNITSNDEVESNNPSREDDCKLLIQH